MKIDRSKAAIIEVAERLFGHHGLDGVSLRHIGQEAGCRNNTAVQYHFGDKEGLVRAIFEYRLPELDRRRKQMLDRARDRQLLDTPHTAVEILLRPIAELVDEAGKHNYAAFLFSLQQVDRVGRMRTDAMSLAPTTHEVASLMRELLSEVDERTLRVRTSAVLAGFYTTLIYLDEQAGDQSLSPERVELLIDDAINWAAAALCLPSRGRS